MRRFFYFKPLTVIFAVILLTFLSCEKEDTNEILNENLEIYDASSLNEAEVLGDMLEGSNNGLKCFKPAEVCGEYKFYPLIAGKHYYAGAIMVYNDSKNLYVNFWGWWLKETHLYVGALENIPKNNNNVPVPGQFPKNYKKYSWGWVTSYVIPLSELPDCFIIAAHAVTKCGETAWAKDFFNPLSFEDVFGVKRWGWIIEDCAEQCQEENIISLKTFIKNPQTGQADLWAVPAGNDFEGEDGWCETMGVLSDAGVYDLIMPYSYPPGEVVGTITVTKENGNTCVSIELDEAHQNLVLWRTHLFYGTQDEFESYVDGCPDFRSFPYTINEESVVHNYCF